jgi:protein phosphatase
MNSVDIIGDVHSCAEELFELIDKLGYRKSLDGQYSHLKNRSLMFVGDLIDRGPFPIEVLTFAMSALKSGIAFFVRGNHDHKLYRYLKKKALGQEINMKLGNGLLETIQALERKGDGFESQVFEFLSSLPLKYEDNNLIVVHGAYREKVSDKYAKSLNLYGEVKKGDLTDKGNPIRLDFWKYDYTGIKTIVVGHSSVDEVEISQLPEFGKIINIDTGACFGNKLTALRYPEFEFISVDSKRKYYEK